MELNINSKIANPSNYIGITPWVILAFGGSFIIASIANDGTFLLESFFVFLYVTSSSLARQIYKDNVDNFLGVLEYGEKHKNWWRIYYSSQIILFAVFIFIYSIVK